MLNPHIYNQNEKFGGLYQRFMSRMYLEQLNYGFSYLSKKNSNTTEASLELKKIIESQLKHFKSSVLKQHFLHNYLREQNFFDFDDQRFLELLTILKSYGFEPESKNVLLSAPCQWINKLSKLVSHCIEQSHSQNSKYTEANLIKSIGNKINIFEQVFGLNLLNLNCQTVNYHYGELTIATKIQNSEIFTKIETNHPMINIDSNQFYTDNSIYSFNFKQALLNDISISKEELKNGIENTTKDDTDIEKSCLEIDYERIINELSMPKTKPSDSLKIVSTDALDSFKIISYKSNHSYINFEVRITDQNSCTNKDAIKAKLMLFLNSNSRAIDAYYKNSQIENFRPDIMDACGPGTRASVQIQGQFKNLNQFFKN